MTDPLQKQEEPSTKFLHPLSEEGEVGDMEQTEKPSKASPDHPPAAFLMDKSRRLRL